MQIADVEHAIIRDLDQAWTDFVIAQGRIEADWFYSPEDRNNAWCYLETARRTIDARRKELDAHRAGIAASEERVTRLAAAVVTIGDPTAAAIAYLVYGPAALTLADTPPAPTAPAAAPHPEPLTAATLPKSEALAKQALADAEDAFWDHAEDCGPCFEGASKPVMQGLCPRGWRLWSARGCAADTASNWALYDGWFRRGGYDRWAADDWIA